jgi:hypothetical protein
MVLDHCIAVHDAANQRITGALGIWTQTSVLTAGKTPTVIRGHEVAGQRLGEPGNDRVRRLNTCPGCAPPWRTS